MVMRGIHFIYNTFSPKWWRLNDPMVSALVSGSSSPGLSPGHCHCVVFLGKTIYSCSVSLHPDPGVYEGTRELNSRGVSNPPMDYIQSRG